MRVMQEEIFCPVLPIVGYRDLDDAIAFFNARPRPLATYHFGTYGTACRRYLNRTLSGRAVTNDVMVHATVEKLPFGGVGKSGMDAYHGRTGLERFSHARCVVRAPLISSNLIMRPPL